MKKITSGFLFLFFTISVLYCQISHDDIEKIDKTVIRAFNTFHPAGLAVAVVKDEQVIYHNGLGFSNAERKELVKTTSLFNIASCTKAFTAASVAMLVDEGKLKWTDKVTDYFPEFRLADDYITRELTVEDLLCHRSGLGTFFGDLLWYNTDYSDEEVMRRIRYEPITRRFGIQYGYQNVMFLVAGKLIEKVSGQTWSEFVTARIFNPLGMNQTKPSNDDLGKDQDIALGHLGLKPLDIYDFNAAKSAAGIYSSADELSIWTILMLNKGIYKGARLVSESSLARIMEPHTIIGASENQKQHGINFYTYGMGWFISDYNGRKIVEHDGGMPGYISKVLLVPSEKISIIILNNGNDFFINSAIRGDLLDILVKGNDFDWISEYSGIKEAYDESEEKDNLERINARVTGTESSHKLADYAGIYRDKSYGDAEVKFTGDRLILTFLPAKTVFTGDLEHWHYDTWKVVFKDEYLTFGLITFSFDEAGKSSGFKIDLPSSDFHFWNLDFRKIK
ncbi:MAG TPA: serine hydrolase [Bacteroidales bacterium]|nr:serine hydrolase [Bacteroidales bacterium]